MQIIRFSYCAFFFFGCNIILRTKIFKTLLKLYEKFQ